MLSAILQLALRALWGVKSVTRIVQHGNEAFIIFSIIAAAEIDRFLSRFVKLTSIGGTLLLNKMEACKGL